MLRLFLRDVETGVTVEAPETPPLFVTDSETGIPKTTLKWDHKTAVGELVRKLAEREEKSPEEILFSPRSFEMYAVWEVG